jgi:hypothetical protein
MIPDPSLVSPIVFSSLIGCSFILEEAVIVRHCSRASNDNKLR